MKKVFLIIVVMLISSMLIVEFKKNSNTLKITVDRTTYIVTMSSAMGFKLTPDFRAKKKYSKLVYHWIADKGEFVNDITGSGKSVKNQGETVLWGAYEKDKVATGTFDIRLEVIDGTSQKVLANANITITSDKGLYKIKN